MMTNDQQAQANLRGIVHMLVAMAFFIVGDALTKAAGAYLPVGEVIALRSLVSGIVLYPFVRRLGVLSRLPALYSKPMMIRNVGEVCGSCLFSITLVNVPIANATALMQTTPLAITAAAAIFLNEPIGWRRWTATGVGFIGALLIIRPGNADFTWWYVPGLLAIGFVVMRDLGTRRIDPAVPTALITFLTFVLIGTGACFMGLFETWRLPEAKPLQMIVGAGLFWTVGASFLVTALRSGGEIAIVIPFRYSIVVWSILIGYFFWGQLPHPVTILGILIVVGAGLYTVHREQVRRRQAMARQG